MKQHIQYLNEVVSKSERSFLSSSPAIDIQSILEDGGIKSEMAGVGGREYIEFTYRGKRYEVIQVDNPISLFDI